MRPTRRLKEFGWNDRVLTRHDFYEICASDGVIVRDAKMRWLGLYLVCDEVPAIVLNQDLRGPERVIVGWHELGHHLLHAPGMAYFCSGSHTKLEHEAQYFAACALMPDILFKTHSAADIEEEFGYPRKLIRFRQKIYMEESA